MFTLFSIPWVFAMLCAVAWGIIATIRDEREDRNRDLTLRRVIATHTRTNCAESVLNLYR